MWGAAALSLTSDVPLATGNGGPRVQTPWIVSPEARSPVASPTINQPTVDRTHARILRPSTGYFAEVQVSSGPLIASGCGSKLSWDQNSIIAVRGTLDCNRREVFHQRCRPKQSIDLSAKTCSMVEEGPPTGPSVHASHPYSLPLATLRSSERSLGS